MEADLESASVLSSILYRREAEYHLAGLYLKQLWRKVFDHGCFQILWRCENEKQLYTGCLYTVCQFAETCILKSFVEIPYGYEGI